MGNKQNKSQPKIITIFDKTEERSSYRVHQLNNDYRSGRSRS